MLELFPTILSALKPTGRLRDWTNFIKLLADGTFPVDNLAFQLLMDVSKWYSSETVYGMRYSKEVKHFWTLGYKLFKEKFIRFMGGHRNIGQISTGGQRGDLRTGNSKINFAVPDVKRLREHYSTGYVARGLLPYRDEKKVFSINMAIYDIDKYFVHILYHLR